MTPFLRRLPTLVACVLVALGLLPTIARSASAPAANAGNAGSAEAMHAVSRFYETYLRHKPPGLPEGADLARIRPFLSHRLAGLVDAALEYEPAWAKAHPDDKPPFVDGDHFTSLFEGPSRFEVLRAEGGEGGPWTVRVRFHADAGTPAWEDGVVVVREDGGYRIDDVLFGGIGEFNPPGRLSDRLRERDAE